VHARATLADAEGELRAEGKRHPLHVVDRCGLSGIAMFGDLNIAIISPGWKVREAAMLRPRGEAAVPLRTSPSGSVGVIV
jgi:hypothetical protein